MLAPGKFGGKKRNFRKRLSDNVEVTQECGDSLTQDTGPVALPSPALNPVGLTSKHSYSRPQQHVLFIIITPLSFVCPVLL